MPLPCILLPLAFIVIVHCPPSNFQVTVVEGAADDCLDMTIVLPYRFSAAQLPQPCNVVRRGSD